MSSIFKYKAGSHIDWVGGRTLTNGNTTKFLVLDLDALDRVGNIVITEL